MKGNGMGFNWRGSTRRACSTPIRAWRDRADELSDSLEDHDACSANISLKHYRGRFYAKAQNLAASCGRLRRGAGETTTCC